MIQLIAENPAIVADLDDVVSPGRNLHVYRRKDGTWSVGLFESNPRFSTPRKKLTGEGKDFASAINDLATKL